MAIYVIYRLPIVATLFLCCSAGLVLPPSGLGNLYPISPNLCTSDSVDFTCSLTSSAWNSSQLQFQLHIGTDPGVLRDCTVIDEKTCVLSLHNLTLVDNLMNVMCCVGSCSELTEVVGEIAAMLFVYETPTIENLTCVLHNWGINGNLVCSWSLGVNNPEASGLMVSLKWRIPDVTATWSICDDQSRERCVWNRSTNGYDRQIDVLLTVNQTYCGKSETLEKRFNSLNYVKPDPVSAIGTSVLGSTCISVNWTHQVTYLKKFLISVDSTQHDHIYKEETIVQTDKSERPDWNHIICGLHPATAYTFSVRARPLVGGYWSEGRSTTNTTDESVPARSPRMATGSYMWNPRDCLFPGAERNVIIYWQPLEQTERNGELQKMVVTFDPPSSYPYVEDLFPDTMQIMQRLRCDEAYTVRVQAYTQVGPSVPPSVLMVPIYTQAVSQPEFMLEMSNGTGADNRRDVYISWVPGQNRDVTGYTVYYCHKEQGTCARNSSIQWLSFCSSENQTMLMLHTPEDYIYAVSMQTEHSSSGLQWKSCIYTKHVAPTRSPGQLEAYEASDNNALSVVWSKLPCESGQPYIQLYRLIYCQAATIRTCSGEELQMIVPSSQTSTILQDLAADVQYAIRVQGITATGARGPLSEPVYATPVDNRLTSGEIVGIAFAVLFVVALAVSGLIFTIKCCKRRAQIILKPVEIDDIPISPEVFKNPNEGVTIVSGQDNEAYMSTIISPGMTEPTRRQLSNDSGFREEPPTPRPDKEPYFPAIHTVPDDYIQWTALQESSVHVISGTNANIVVFNVQAGPNPGIGPSPCQIPNMTDILKRDEIPMSDKCQGKISTISTANPADREEGKLMNVESTFSYVEASLIQGGSPTIAAHGSHDPSVGHEDDRRAETVTTAIDINEPHPGVEHITHDSINENIGQLSCMKEVGATTDVANKQYRCLVKQSSEVDSDSITDESTPLLVVPSHKPPAQAGADLAAMATSQAGIQAGTCSTRHEDVGKSPTVTVLPSAEEQMTSVSQPRNQIPNHTTSNHGSDGYVTDEQMTSVSQPRNQIPNHTTSNHGSDGYVTDEQMTSLSQTRNQIPNHTTSNHGSDGYVTDEQMTSVSQPRKQIPNHTTSNHGSDGYVTDEQMTSVSQPRNQMPNHTTSNHGSDGYVTDEQMTSVSQAINKMPNHTTSNHGSDGYVTDEQMTSLGQPRKQIPNHTTSNHGSDGYVTDEQMTSVSQPRNQMPNHTTSNHGSDGYVTDEQMTSLSKPRNQIPNHTTSNHSSDGYVTDEQMTSVSQPRNQIPNHTTSNHGSDGYVTDEQMTSISQPRNQIPNHTTSNHGSDVYVTDEQMTSLSQPRKQIPNYTTSNHSSDGYVTDEQMTSVSQPRKQIPNHTTSNHSSDGYVTDEHMTSVSQPKNQIPNHTTSNHDNDGYVTDEKMTSLSQL